MERVILYGETSSEITNLLVEKVKSAAKSNSPEEIEKWKRIYLNWIKFVGSLESDGSLFGLTAINSISEE